MYVFFIFFLVQVALSLSFAPVIYPVSLITLNGVGVTEPPVTRRDEAQLYELDDIAGT